MTLSYLVNNLIYIYIVLILIRALLSWIPNLDWYSQPLKTLSVLTDSFLNIFKKFIPPVSGLDFSPVVAIIVLKIVQKILVIGLVSVGL